MINPNLIKLTEKLKNDSNYLKEMQAIKNSQEMFDYCSKIVSGYSKDEFDTFIQNIVNVNNTINLLSNETLSLVTGGAGFIDWVKNKMPTMPANSHELRLKVKANPEGQGGQWANNIDSTANRLSQISRFIKVGEIIYFDELENISPENFGTFINDFMEGGLGLS